MEIAGYIVLSIVAACRGAQDDFKMNMPIQINSKIYFVSAGAKSDHRNFPSECRKAGLKEAFPATNEEVQQLNQKLHSAMDQARFWIKTERRSLVDGKSALFWKEEKVEVSTLEKPRFDQDGDEHCWEVGQALKVYYNWKAVVTSDQDLPRSCKSQLFFICMEELVQDTTTTTTDYWQSMTSFTKRTSAFTEVLPLHPTMVSSSSSLTPLTGSTHSQVAHYHNSVQHRQEETMPFSSTAMHFNFTQASQFSSTQNSTFISSTRSLSDSIPISMVSPSLEVPTPSQSLFKIESVSDELELSTVNHTVSSSQVTVVAESSIRSSSTSLPETEPQASKSYHPTGSSVESIPQFMISTELSPLHSSLPFHETFSTYTNLQMSTATPHLSETVTPSILHPSGVSLSMTTSLIEAMSLSLLQTYSVFISMGTPLSESNMSQATTQPSNMTAPEVIFSSRTMTVSMPTFVTEIMTNSFNQPSSLTVATTMFSTETIHKQLILQPSSSAVSMATSLPETITPSAPLNSSSATLSTPEWKPTTSPADPLLTFTVKCVGPDGLCRCMCPLDIVRTNVSVKELQEKIRKELNVDVSKLSATTRRLISIQDYRLSATFISLPAIFIVVLIFCAIFLADFLRLYAFVCRTC